MDKQHDASICGSVSCPFRGVEDSIREIKKVQEKFAEKQDAILLILSEQKAMTVEIHNLKQSMEDFKDDIKTALEENKDIHIDLYNRLNKLEQHKADKSETKQIGGWIWGGVILVLSALINFFLNHTWGGK